MRIQRFKIQGVMLWQMELQLPGRFCFARSDFDMLRFVGYA
jgi:hypothetical protein